MSKTKLIYKYASLNMLVFEQKNFFQELLRVAMKGGMISLKEGAECNDLMMEYVLKEFEVHVAGNEILKELPECKDYFLNNHLYMLSLYLFERFTPAKALITIMEKPAKQVYKESVEYFEKVINDIYKKLLAFGDETYMNEDMREKYAELCKDIKAVQNFDECKGRLDKCTMYDTWSDVFLPLNYYEFSNDDVVNYFRKLVDSFVIETKILNELGWKDADVLASLINFAYDIIRKRRTRLPQNNNTKDKREVILEISADEVLEMMFKRTGEVEFSDVSKKHITKFFLRKLERGWLYYE